MGTEFCSGWMLRTILLMHSIMSFIVSLMSFQEEDLHAFGAQTVIFFLKRLRRVIAKQLPCTANEKVWYYFNAYLVIGIYTRYLFSSLWHFWLSPAVVCIVFV